MPNFEIQPNISMTVCNEIPLLVSVGGRCQDPGTPGGAVQVVRSYEAGELLRFRCIRSGFETVPSAPLLCEQKGNNITEWNSTLPSCTGENVLEIAKIHSQCLKMFFLPLLELLDKFQSWHKAFVGEI